MTAAGSGYVSWAFSATCEALKRRHLRPCAYTLRTYGEAERVSILPRTALSRFSAGRAWLILVDGRVVDFAAGLPRGGGSVLREHIDARYRSKGFVRCLLLRHLYLVRSR